MWRTFFTQYRDSGPFGGVYRQYSAAQANPASRVAMIAAALVIGLPLLVLLLAAVLIGVAVFIVMIAVMRVMTLVRAGLEALGLAGSGSDPTGEPSGGGGRRNVRVIHHD